MHWEPAPLLLKLVREGSRPNSGDSGLFTIRDAAALGRFTDAPVRGTLRTNEDKSAYIEHLLGYVDRSSLKPLKIVVNSGNGARLR
jgi:phosphomannomutase